MKTFATMIVSLTLLLAANTSFAGKDDASAGGGSPSFDAPAQAQPGSRVTDSQPSASLFLVPSVSASSRQLLSLPQIRPLLLQLIRRLALRRLLRPLRQRVLRMIAAALKSLGSACRGSA